MTFQLAQINIARGRGALDGELMREFVEALDEINALAEASPGFVWRLKTESGNATSVVAYPDPRIIVNMSVWASFENLRDYVYRSMHGRFFARRKQWFEELEQPHLALWWIPQGNVPTIEEAKERLASIAAHGDTPFAFSFKQRFPPEGTPVK